MTLDKLNERPSLQNYFEKKIISNVKAQKSVIKVQILNMKNLNRKNKKKLTYRIYMYNKYSSIHSISILDTTVDATYPL